MTTNVELGWSLPTRLQYFDEHRPNATARHRLEFMGEQHSLPIIRAPIGLPKYRITNGRTASLQQEYLARNPELGAEFFSGDPERQTVQKVQHELLLRLVAGAGLEGFFRDSSNKQSDPPLILDQYGYVVNGNRRLCCWRELYAQDPATYSHFSHIDVALLPPADPKAIDDLEARLQIQPELRDEYAWHAKANMLLDRQKMYDLSDQQLAKLYRMKVPEVRTLFDMRLYAIDYLRSRGKESMWSDVTDNEYALRQIIEKRKKIQDIGKRRLYEEACFLILDDPGDGRAYQTVQDVQTYIAKIEAELSEAFPSVGLEEGNGESDATPSFFDDETSAQSRPISLAQEIAKPENRDEARAVIVDVIEGQKEVQKSKSKANSALFALKKANSQVQEAVASLTEQTNTTGLAEQIDQIEGGLGVIRKWLDGSHT